jgi:threonine dehydrogenase-like Zn-dependent dehydrogenase
MCGDQSSNLSDALFDSGLYEAAPAIDRSRRHIDPSFVVTRPASLEDAPAMYKKFRDKEDGFIKVVLRPGR